MAEVWFYHLERTTADAELPGLLQRGLERGLRMAVITSSVERVRDFSQKLWGLDETSFIPHGFQGEPRPDAQSIFLCTNDVAVNQSVFNFYIDGAEPTSIENLDRATIMFDGTNDFAIEKARALWRKFKSGNVAIRYWKQDDDGRWKDQAAQT
jgi:DNA polymerase III subunit chi